MLVEEHASGYRERGIDDHRRGVEDSVAAGVRMQVTDIWASSSITIIEGNYLNPPDDPQHCPATHTEVRIHPEGKTSSAAPLLPATRQPSPRSRPAELISRPRLSRRSLGHGVCDRSVGRAPLRHVGPHGKREPGGR